jgi:TPR repeat protein
MEVLRRYAEGDNFSALCALANACIFATALNIPQAADPSHKEPVPGGDISGDDDSDIGDADDDEGWSERTRTLASNFASGRALLKKSIDLGDSTAPVDMVTLLYMDLEDEAAQHVSALSERVNEVIKYYKLGVDRQCPTSSAGLGKLFEAGYGDALPPDAEMAARCYRSGLGTGMEAPYCLGELLEHGAPKVDRDAEEALVWYRVAHRRGHSDAGVSIAALLLDPSAHDGAGPSEEDVRCAAEALVESIRMGSADAMHYLGVLHHEGAPGLPANLTEARKLYMWSVCLQLKHMPGVSKYHRNPGGACCDHGCRGAKKPSESGCRCAASLFNIGQIEFETENYVCAANCYLRARDRGCCAAAENLASL